MPKIELEEVTTAEAAELLNCSERTIRRMIERGTIAARMEKIDPTVKKGVYKIPKYQIDMIIKQAAIE